jgi:uncharacterized damage-inducible protein DinB
MYRKINDFLKDWKYETESTLKLFAGLTDESLNQKVHENIRSVGRLAWHITQTLSEMPHTAKLFETNELASDTIPAHVSDISKTYEKYAQIVAEVVPMKWKDEELEDKLEMYGDKWEKGIILSILILHQTHHRGQLTVIMRLLGLPVAGVYGPSKEEYAAWGMTAPE